MFLKRAGDGSLAFYIGGFALGFLLGLIGVLIAYLINDDKKAAGQNGHRSVLQPRLLFTYFLLLI